MRMTNPRFHVRLSLLFGIFRRLRLQVFRPAYVRAQLAARQGECQRCGACCQMAWRCTFLHQPDGKPACAFYKYYRYPNCVNFPIDDRDIADRDLVSPDRTCGYHWDRKGSIEKGKKS